MCRAREKTALLMAVVCEVIIDAEACLSARTEYEIAVGRHRALQPRDVFAVVAQLQEKVRLGVQREFGVDDLVAPRPAFARRLDAPQKVGAAEKRAVEKRRLIDHGCAAGHRGERFRFRRRHLRERVVLKPRFEHDHRVAVQPPQIVEVARFVRVAFAGDELDGRTRFRPHPQPRRKLVLEPG